MRRRPGLLLLFALGLLPAARAEVGLPADFQPDPRAVHRYPQDGWIVLHIEPPQRS